MSEPLVEIDHLTKSFTSSLPPALNSLSAVIPKGELVGLVGPDGAGKTTLIRLIAGLLKPTEGSIRVSKKDSIQDAEYIHNKTGYMPQRFGLYEDLSVMQNLILYADLKGVDSSKRKDTFERLLGFTGLAPFTKRLARALSGGMKQKLGLACALIKKPLLLLLDEPSVGVDPISRRELWKMVRELLKDDISVVWSTAYLDEAERCDTVLLINEGNLLFSGQPDELTKKVENRTYKIINIKENHRSLLSKILQREEIIDGVIQGSDLRIVLKEHASLPQDLGETIKTPPRFEDAFIDILGGGPGGDSAFVDITPNIEKKGNHVIVASNLTKKFGSFVAASDINCKVKRGEIFGLIGPNGAGKSTTFKMLCGLLKPTEGTASVNDFDLQAAPAKARALIGYMAQKFSLYGILSAQQNLDFFSGIYKLSGSQKNKAISEMLDIFNLTELKNVTTDLLPLGYKQRLALACSTMHHPEILFLDEPTSGVDPITRREFWNHINGLVEKGVTIMVTTHFMDEAEYCDRIALIYNGNIIETATPEELKAKVASDKDPNPTLEDAFIRLIEAYDKS